MISEDLDRRTATLLLDGLIALKKGDFSYRLPRDLLGLGGTLADTFNIVIEINQRLASEVDRLSRVVGTLAGELQSRQEELRQTHQQLEEKVKLLAEQNAEANRLKDEFLAVLSHELRTPLNAILGWSRMLADGRLGPAMMRRGLDSISRNAGAQLALVNDILDVSRFVAGTFRFEMAPLDVRVVVAAAIETGRAAAQAKGIRLDATLPAAAVTVNGDASRLQQVIWNLVSNAVKFTGDNGAVQVDLSSDERAMTLRVRDNGIGIAADFLPHVFDRFRQADSSTSRVSGGLGLGLAIVKQIVETHGGAIAASSEGQGLGTTLTVTLPLAGQPAALAAAEARLAEMAVPGLGPVADAAATIPASEPSALSLEP